MEFTNPSWLRFTYGANILILAPVCWAMLSQAGGSAVFQGTVAESPGLRLLVFSLWAAILAASVGGLLAPAFFAPLLLIQIAYKTLWLLLFIAPRLMRGEKIPAGIAVTFAAIVATYPFLFALAR